MTSYNINGHSYNIYGGTSPNGGLNESLSAADISAAISASSLFAQYENSTFNKYNNINVIFTNEKRSYAYSGLDADGHSWDIYISTTNLAVLIDPSSQNSRLSTFLDLVLQLRM